MDKASATRFFTQRRLVSVEGEEGEMPILIYVSDSYLRSITWEMGLVLISIGANLFR